MADRTPRTPRVLLTTLSVRTSGRGTNYLSGYLGKAKVVAFAGEADRWGNPTWNLYLEHQEPRAEDGHQRRPDTRRDYSARPGASAGRADAFDDEMPF